MKVHLMLLLAMSFICTADLKADLLGDEDDTYVGLQLMMPLESKSAGQFFRNAQHSLLMIGQSDGIREGVAFTQFGHGMREVSYLSPSNNFEIGTSRISDHAIPLMRIDDEGIINTGYSENSMGALQLGVFLVASAVIVLYVVDETVDETVEILDDAFEDEEEGEE